MSRFSIAAIFASGNRVLQLAAIKAPALIIHGRDDRLMPLAAAHELAAHIRGARLEVIDGMGHDIPKALIARLARSVLLHIDSAETLTTLPIPALVLTTRSKHHRHSARVNPPFSTPGMSGLIGMPERLAGKARDIIFDRKGAKARAHGTQRDAAEAQAGTPSG